MSVTVTVASKEALQAALLTATQGLTIRVEGGAYGLFSLPETDGAFPPGVTIAAADPSDPPVFDSLLLQDVTDLTFDGVDFDLRLHDGSPMVHLQDTSGVTILGASEATESQLASFTTISAQPAAAADTSGTPDAATATTATTGSGAAPDLSSSGASPSASSAAGATASSATPASSSGPTITVSNLSELKSALAQATGGETILVQGGNYGRLDLVNGRQGVDVQFGSDVTIASADPADPAVFSSISLRGASNMTLDGLVVDYNFQPGDNINAEAIRVMGSSNITVRNSVLDGDVASGTGTPADGYGFGLGVMVRTSQDVTVESNEIYGFFRGITVKGSDQVSVLNNDLHSMRKDGFNASEVIDLLVEGNHIHDFIGNPNASDHRDMIQLWTLRTSEQSQNITIRGNVLDIGQGDETQSILMSNQLAARGQAGIEMYFKNVLIEDNVIVNRHLNGLRIGESDGLTIRNNTVLHSDGAQVDGRDPPIEIPRIFLSGSSQNVVVEDNITSQITGYNGQSSWSVQNNLIAQDQDPNASGYYGNLFVSSNQIDVNGGFLAIPGGTIDNLGVGSAATRGLVSSPGPTPTPTPTPPPPTPTPTPTPPPTPDDDDDTGGLDYEGGRTDAGSTTGGATYEDDVETHVDTDRHHDDLVPLV